MQLVLTVTDKRLLISVSDKENNSVIFVGKQRNSEMIKLKQFFNFLPANWKFDATKWCGGMIIITNQRNLYVLMVTYHKNHTFIT